ncbi:MAG TPA: hypothetical protein PLL36_09355, partial [Candidatus Hydrogenedentes bacterium]|nr:hypothetical protein [Candidatus Hydrogenedentota bacterium]
VLIGFTPTTRFLTCGFGDDEIAIRDEESTPFAASGNFVACPCIAAYMKRSLKKCLTEFRRIIEKNPRDQ